ncbi:hypothetical protein NL676_000355 [Syzygium grande]|nr:hypothetical protein NL676_000355 [Syzygium grande]
MIVDFPGSGGAPVRDVAARFLQLKNRRPHPTLVSNAAVTPIAVHLIAASPDLQFPDDSGSLEILALSFGNFHGAEETLTPDAYEGSSEPEIGLWLEFGLGGY